MTPQEISERLVAIHTALVEKTGVQPFLEPMLRVYQGGTCGIRLYRDFNGGDYDIADVKSGSFEGVFDKAEAFIANMPDPDTQKKQDFQKRLAKLIDEGAAINVSTDVITMLRGGMEALSENLLTYQEAGQ